MSVMGKRRLLEAPFLLSKSAVALRAHILPGVRKQGNHAFMLEMTKHSVFIGRGGPA